MLCRAKIQMSKIICTAWMYARTERQATERRQPIIVVFFETDSQCGLTLWERPLQRGIETSTTLYYHCTMAFIYIVRKKSARESAIFKQCWMTGRQAALRKRWPLQCWPLVYQVCSSALEKYIFRHIFLTGLFYLLKKTVLCTCFVISRYLAGLLWCT